MTDPNFEPPVHLAGLAGAPVRSVRALDAAAWVSDLPAGVGAATPELARAHDLVVRAALALETPLPARFGQTFADEETLRRSLVARAAGIVRALERVRGAVEMTMRILLDEPMAGTRSVPPKAAPAMTATAVGAAGSGRRGGGRAYLDRIRERQRAAAETSTQAEFLQARVARAVMEVAREAVISPLTPSAHSLGVAHLVARADVERYRAVGRALAGQEPSIRLMVSGPWAPYSFSGITGG